VIIAIKTSASDVNNPLIEAAASYVSVRFACTLSLIKLMPRRPLSDRFPGRLRMRRHPEVASVQLITEKCRRFRHRKHPPRQMRQPCQHSIVFVVTMNEWTWHTFQRW